MPSGSAPISIRCDLLFARTTMRHIHELIVRGRSVVREGEVLGIDYPAMRDDLLARLRAAMAAERVRSPRRCCELERAVRQPFLADAPCC